MKRIRIVIICIILLSVAAPAYSEEWDWKPDKVFVQLYGSQFVDTNFSDILTFSDVGKTKNAYMLVAGGGAEKFIWEDYLGLGVEANVGVHWGNRETHFYEFTAAPYLRWYQFPWRDTLATYITIGDGASYNTAHAQYERDYGSSHGKLEARLLNYLFLELGVGATKHIDIYYRVHHRCSAWGTVGSDKSGGTNFHSIGFRYNF